MKKRSKEGIKRILLMIEKDKGYRFVDRLENEKHLRTIFVAENQEGEIL